MSKTSMFFRLSFASATFLVFAFAFSNYTSSQPKPELEGENQTIPQEGFEQSVVDTTPHNLVGSFYTLDYGTDAKLLLNNKGIALLEVQPTLYNKQGQELQLPSVTVEPQSFRFINIQDWASIGGESFRSGSIKLFHTGKDLVLGSQIYLTQEAQSLAFEEKLAELGKFDSRKQEAVWVMPTQQTKAAVVLTNTTNVSLSLTAKLSKNPTTVGSPQSFQLAAHESKILDLKQDFTNGNQFANSTIVGLSLEHTSVKDALLARVMVGDVAKGYSNVVQFSNPNTGKSSEYQGVGFQIEDINGLRFAPVIVAKNVGATTATITTRVPYTRIDGTRGTINLPQKQLLAGESGLINTQNIVTRTQQEQIKVASLEVEYNSAPGSVIVATHSVSTDGNQVFRVPMWDPLGQRSPTGGYPWRIEGTSTTETYIKNITDQDQDYVAYLVWENNGIYMIGMKSIAGRETVHIDVKKLRDDQTPDEKGRIIPLSVSSGQLQWTLRRKDSLPDDDVRTNLSLIGRSEQVDLTKGIVNNYACQNCCSGSIASAEIKPLNPFDDGELEYPDSRRYVVYQTDETCYGGSQPYIVQGVTWSVNNSSIATIDGSGQVTAVSEGNATIRAFWRPRISTATQPCPPPQYLIEGDFITEIAEQCIKDDENNSEKKVESKENADNNPPNIAPCGSCTSRTINFDSYLGVIVVPKVTINVPSTAKDGDTVTFSATAQGGTPTAYQWNFVAPTGAGNNPQVDFTSATSASTQGKAKWFSSPDDACTAPFDSRYEIRATVTFQSGRQITKSSFFTVNALWNPAGRTTADHVWSGSLQIGPDINTGVWYVVGPGSFTRTRTTSKLVYIPSTSQFYNKTSQHEEVHKDQWKSGGLLGVHFNPTDFYNRVRNFSAPTRTDLENMVLNDFQAYLVQEDNATRGKCNQAELEAYAVSDPISPLYLYQRCGRTVFQNCQ
jgi:hypothetical protein